MLGFGAGTADTKAENLSGGEKARLLFALATFHGPHLLILDEPTNHLDVDAREALVHALNDYEGAVILISHDRHLIEACADRLWIVRGGTVRPIDGDLDDYAELVHGLASSARRAEAEAADGGAGGAPRTRQSGSDQAAHSPMPKPPWVRCKRENRGARPRAGGCLRSIARSRGKAADFASCGSGSPSISSARRKFGSSFRAPSMPPNPHGMVEHRALD